MQQPHYVSETQILLAVAGDPSCRYIWTTHVLKQMEARGITQPDMEYALTNGRVILAEMKSDLLWRVKGTDVDGNKIGIIVAVDEVDTMIKVVTTF